MVWIHAIMADMDKAACVWVGIGTNWTIGDNEHQTFFELNKWLVDHHNSRIIFNSTNQPHLNYYDLDVPKENLASIEGELQNIAE